MRYVRIKGGVHMGSIVEKESWEKEKEGYIRRGETPPPVEYLDGETVNGESIHHSPVSEHCERVLAEPPKCYDFRGARAFCLCWAWNEMEKKKLSRLPVGEAWQELRRVCRTE